MTTRISQRCGSGSDEASDQAGRAPLLFPAFAGTLASDIPTTNLEDSTPLSKVSIA
jgi:hypothetical protein